MSTTQTHRALERDSRRLDLVSTLGIACAIVAALAAAVAVGSMHPPPSLVDDLGQVR